jgi:hypothetical protein
LSKIAEWFRQLAPLVARVEIALLASWIAIVGAVWSFLALGSEMREGELAAQGLRTITREDR